MAPLTATRSTLAATKMKLLIVFICVIIFLSSCGQPEEKNFSTLIFVTLDSDKTTSFKLATTDTLFREMKFPNSTSYSYRVLSRADKKQLLDLIGHLKRKGQVERSYAIGPNQKILFIASDTAKAYYTSQTVMQNSELKNVINWFMRYESKNGFEESATNANFWTIDGIQEPPPPPTPEGSNKIVMPIT